MFRFSSISKIDQKDKQDQRRLYFLKNESPFDNYRRLVLSAVLLVYRRSHTVDFYPCMRRNFAARFERFANTKNKVWNEKNSGARKGWREESEDYKTTSPKRGTRKRTYIRWRSLI